MKGFVTILFLIAWFLKAQIPVFSLAQDTLFFINDNQIQTKNGGVIYTTQGNILFKGNSTSYKNILLTFDIDSLLQKKEAVSYTNQGSLSNYTIKNGTLYYTTKNKEISLVQYEKNKETWAVYSSLNDSLLFYVPSLSISPIKLLGLTFEYMNSTDFLQVAKKKAATQENSYAAVVPLNHNGITWIWDGQLLYPYGASIHSNLVWMFDGEKLAPRNFARTQEEWKWDGSTLKPYWGGDPTYHWSWQHGVLRQVWNNNYKNEFMIDDNVLRKRFSNFGEPEWEIQGDIPLAIITAVALRILYR